MDQKPAPLKVLKVWILRHLKSGNIVLNDGHSRLAGTKRSILPLTRISSAKGLINSSIDPPSARKDKTCCRGIGSQVKSEPATPACPSGLVVVWLRWRTFDVMSLRTLLRQRLDRARDSRNPKLGHRRPSIASTRNSKDPREGHRPLSKSAQLLRDPSAGRVTSSA
jgi:hypothetical protein